MRACGVHGAARCECVCHGTHACVSLAFHPGSFNNWEAPIPLGKTEDTGDFVRTVALPAGTYQVCVFAHVMMPVNV